MFKSIIRRKIDYWAWKPSILDYLAQKPIICDYFCVKSNIQDFFSFHLGSDGQNFLDHANFYPDFRLACNVRTFIALNRTFFKKMLAFNIKFTNLTCWRAILKSIFPIKSDYSSIIWPQKPII
jgi:hypothetical protein